MEIHSRDRSVGIDALFQYAGTGIQLISGTLFYLAIVRFFNTTSFGAISLLIAIIGLFNIIFTFGMNTTAQHFLSYEIGKDDHKTVNNIIRRILSIGLSFSIIGSISLMILSPYISITLFHNSTFTSDVRFLSIILVGYVLFGILNGVLLGLKEFKKSGMINILTWLVYYFGVLPLMIIEKSIQIMIIGWGIGIFLGVVIEILAITRSMSAFKKANQKTGTNFIISYAFPIFISSLLGYGAVYIDRFIVADIMTLHYLALYNFALLIVSSISFIAIPFNNILLTRFSELYAENDRHELSRNIRMAVKLLSAIYVPIAVILASLCRPIIIILAGSNYAGGTLAAQIVIMSSAVFISLNVFTQSIASIRLTKIFIISGLASLSSNLILSVVLIPQLGITGAALGFSSVYAMTFSILVFYLMREKLLSTDLYGLSKIWVSSMTSFLVVYVIQNFVVMSLILLPVYVALGALIYLFMVRATKVFNLEGDSLLLSIFPSDSKLMRSILRLIIS